MSEAVKQEEGTKQTFDENRYPFRQTEYPFRDKIFNNIVRRHLSDGKKKKGLPWTKSDDFVWGGSIYVVWDFIPQLLFLFFVYYIVNMTYDHYGWFKAITVLGVMVLIRVNSLIRQQQTTNRFLKKMQG
jgi:hypothetical protein